MFEQEVVEVLAGELQNVGAREPLGVHPEFPDVQPECISGHEVADCQADLFVQVIESPTVRGGHGRKWLANAGCGKRFRGGASDDEGRRGQARISALAGYASQTVGLQIDKPIIIADNFIYLPLIIR